MEMGKRKVKKAYEEKNIHIPVKIGLFMFILFMALLFSSIFQSQWVSAASKEKYVVVIDPGHGGYDGGAVGRYNGTQYEEADLVLKIAKYLKTELKQYSNIKVYMTRTSASICPSLSERVQMGALKNADLLVSLHLNACNASSVKGACVLVSNGNYRSYIAEQEKTFARLVIKELNAIGLSTYSSNTGGLFYRSSGDGSRYPNGKLKDYYQIIWDSVMKNIPGVIIEHAFISSPSDIGNFLNSNAKLKKIAQADARAIVSYFKTISCQQSDGKTTSSGFTGWIQKYGKYFYYNKGELYTNKLFKVNGSYYYVDKEGIRQTGWLTYNNKKYYFDSDGKAHTKWLKYNGDWYYFNKSKCYAYTNVVNTTAAGNIYVFDADGKRCSGWCTMNGKKYYIGSKGYGLKGIQKIGSSYYYFHPTKAYLYKSKLIKLNAGEYVYADSNGKLYCKGLKTVGTKTYYFQKNATTYTGWKKISGKWYYFSKTSAGMIKGRSMTSSKGKVYVFDSKGVCISGKE